MTVQDALQFIQIITSTSLIVVIILQAQGQGLGGLFGGGDSMGITKTRRGLERTLFQITVGLAVAFLVSAARNARELYLAEPLPPRRNQAGLLALAAVPIVLAIAVKLTASDGPRGGGLVAQITANGLRKGEFTISDAALTHVIRYYTREAGVRNLEREIAKLARKAVTDILKKKTKTVEINPAKAEEYLGVQRHRYGLAEKEDQVGVVTGLAWTSVGGDLLHGVEDVPPAPVVQGDVHCHSPTLCCQSL